MYKLFFKKEKGLVDISRVEKFLYSAFPMLKNGDYEIQISKKTQRRSLNQNSLMWMWFNCLADNFGCTSKDMHDILCKELSTNYVTIGDKQFKVPISTSKLNTEEFSIFMERVQNWALTEGEGIRLPTPSDQCFEEFEKRYKI